MLQIKDISKQYKTGELIQIALDHVSLNLRNSEFVAILGPSGSGKTTLLNIIGGLDHYDNGDLIINGISTKEYRDNDWDAYRNHTIGFVFQSYNLIPHQSILANVELALTIGGLSRGVRRQRAKKALTDVGLGDQLHKRPNQMSGGQMQRVAIARALVNNPDVLLADEPTGALDTETSIQVMELLREVAKNRLVVMVTHNPELAKEYATRIIKLKDGKIAGDSDPYWGDVEETETNEAEAKEVEIKEPEVKEAEVKKIGKAKMNFLTSLSLSFNNLLTKKTRTILTSFAGSIGIIGIALILALSTGVNDYISRIQKDTMESYPISISAQTLDMSSMMNTHAQVMDSRSQSTVDTSRTGIYSDSSIMEITKMYVSNITENNLTVFKTYLEDSDNEINQYLGENGVVYTYNVSFDVYTHDPNGVFLNTNSNADEKETTQGFSIMMGNNSMFDDDFSVSNPFDNLNRMLSGAASSAENFSEMMTGADGAAVSAVITDSYDVLHGRWPEAYNEVVLVLDENHSIDTNTLFQLGLITKEAYDELQTQIDESGEAEVLHFEYDDVCEHSFYLIPACDHYTENSDGTFSYIGEDMQEVERLSGTGVELEITGIIQPKENAANASVSTAIGYTSLLTDYVIAHSNNSPVVKVQEKDSTVNVLTGVDFEAANDEKKIADTSSYISTMTEPEKASLYTMILYYSASSTDENDERMTSQNSASKNHTRHSKELIMDEAVTAETAMDDAIMDKTVMAETDADKAAIDKTAMAADMDDAAMAAAMDLWLTETPDNKILLMIYDEYIGGSSYEENIEAFGKTSYNTPASISIYTDSFEDKEAVADCISRYNETASEDDQITYVDYVKLMTSSLTTIIDVISYVLVAFVAVSLIVSCIMISIITHISVLERTKEIGILRALGASKRNIFQVFNAETIIIGLCAGILGTGISALLTIPINAAIRRILGAETVSAYLPPVSAIVLVAISVIVTVIGGLLPAKKAAKKDPVIALRTE